jgi:hypothetical protein
LTKNYVCGMFPLRSAAWLIFYHEADEELKKKMDEVLGGS